jgi:DNA-binding MarR family transcriptional regulator
MSISLLEFSNKLSEIMPFIAREFARQQAQDFYKTKLTLPQCIILELLHKSGEAKMTDLARFLSVSAAAITGVVDRLVADGCVVRLDDSNDRRIRKIKLSAKGQKLTKKVMEHKRKVTMKIFDNITEQERIQYLNILTHVMEHLKENSKAY